MRTARGLRWLAAALLALVLAAGACQACSLAYAPFGMPTWAGAEAGAAPGKGGAGDLLFVDGTHLVRVHERAEATVEEAHMLSFAPAGDALLVAGQDGLGADCSGTDWLQLVRRGTTVWRQGGEATVWAHPDGPFVLRRGMLHRLDGDALVELGIVVQPPESVVGWSTDGQPVIASADGLRIGHAGPHLAGTAAAAVAASGGPRAATGILDVDGADVRLRIVLGAAVDEVRWPLPEPSDADPAGHRIGLAWADGWYAAAGGHAFHVAANLSVFDLGIPAVSVGARPAGATAPGGPAQTQAAAGPAGVLAAVFGPSSIHLFSGLREAEAHDRIEGLWLPGALQATATPVPSTTQVQAAPTVDASGEDTPSLGAGALSLTLALAFACVRRRRRPGTA